MLRQLEQLPQQITTDILSLVDSIGEIQAKILLEENTQKELNRDLRKQSVKAYEKDFARLEQKNKELINELIMLETIERGDITNRLKEASTLNSQLKVQLNSMLDAEHSQQEKENAQIGSRIKAEKEEIKQIIKMSKDQSTHSYMSSQELSILKKRIALEMKIAEQSQEKEELFQYIRDFAAKYKIQKTKNGKLLALICNM